MSVAAGFSNILKRSVSKPFLVITIVALFAVSGNLGGWIPSTSAQIQGDAKVAVNPTSIAGLQYVPGTVVTFQVNVTNAQPFAGFTVALSYNREVLRAQGFDTSGGILGDDAFFSSECIDGSGAFCLPDLSFDGAGVASLSLFTSSGLNVTSPSGKLFSVSFIVTTTGFSAIHFTHQELGYTCFTISPSCPFGFGFLQSVANDGYFTNEECGTGNLCRPPTVSLNAPTNTIINQPQLFRAVAESQNPAGYVTEYNWTWRQGADFHLYNSPPQASLTPSPNVSITFSHLGPWTVTLSAQDNYGARAYYVQNIEVNQIQLSVSIFFTNPDLQIIPMDPQGNSIVNAIIAGGTVRSVNPGRALLWVNVTNISGQPLQSLKLNETLPSDWEVSPSWLPSKGALHVYFANTTSLATNPEFTQPSIITVSTTKPQSVELTIPNFADLIGHSLLFGQSILLSIKLAYALTGTNQSASSYPRNNTSTAALTAWSETHFTGNNSTGQGSAVLRVIAGVFGPERIPEITIV